MPDKYWVPIGCRCSLGRLLSVNYTWTLNKKKSSLRSDLFLLQHEYSCLPPPTPEKRACATIFLSFTERVFADLASLSCFNLAEFWSTDLLPTPICMETLNWIIEIKKCKKMPNKTRMLTVFLALIFAVQQQKKTPPHLPPPSKFESNHLKKFGATSVDSSTTTTTL